MNVFDAEEAFDELMACRHGILCHFQAVDTWSAFFCIDEFVKRKALK